MESNNVKDRNGKNKQDHFKNDLQFYINGKKHTIKNPDPQTLLVNYLRSTEVGLTGTKHACGQGGCGSCTVMLSYWDEVQNKAVNVSCNSCLRPIVALDGMEITTIEGLGSVDTEISPIQYAIAVNNGSQCGYCTPGFVMNMHSMMIGCEEELTKKQIEQSFDGNICRCTGFRPILYAMKTFASDWSPEDAKGTPDCCVDPAEQVPQYETPRGIDLNHLSKTSRPLHFLVNGVEWYRPLHLEEVHRLMIQYKDVEVKLVCGNTSVGIPAVNPVQPKVMIDISLISELKETGISNTGITVGASTTYTEFLDLLDAQLGKVSNGQKKGLKALHYMAIRTAGRIVRNVASLAGNTMLVARNVTSGYPFPSDLFIALSVLGTEISVSVNGKKVKMTLPAFVDRYNSDIDFAKNAIIVSYHIPYTKDNDYVHTYKVAIRIENSHSLANAGIKVSLDDHNKITSASIFVGGITTHPVKAQETENFMIGKTFSKELLSDTLPILTNELEKIIANVPAWVKDIPTEGITDQYRVSLVQGYLFKYFVEVLSEINPAEVPQEDLTAKLTAFDRPVSRGQQKYTMYPNEFPVSQPYIKLSAFEQATGEAIYTHDIPVPVKGLQGAFVTSTNANANFHYHIPLGNGKFHRASIDEIIEHITTVFSGVVDFITYRDIPKEGTNGTLLTQPFAPDPIFCVDNVTCYGQCIGLVLADKEQTAIDAAAYLTNQCIAYTSSEPILELKEAILAGNLFPGYTKETDDNQQITKPGSDISWAIKTGTQKLFSGLEYSSTVLNGINCVVVAGTQQTGDQMHFYMESQSCFSRPGEKRQMIVSSSTQSPTSVQTDIGNTLFINENNIEIDIKRLGGGYGGKTTRTTYVASPVTLASYKHRRPVRVAMPREIDSYMIGKRHPFRGEYNIAIVPEGPDKGKIVGTVYEFYSDGGNTQDCSFDVMDCAVLGADNAYMVQNFQTSGYVYKTNKSSNGAMRSYGGVQCGLITEESIEAAAHKIGMLPEDIREKNLYVMGDFTPYGQQLEYCIMKDVWKRLKKTSDFEAREKAVQDFNSKNKWKKRGISMIPLKYGLGYNLGFLMQGGAHIDIYASDGSVLISHGGVEMGQGVMTKVAQIAANTLNIPLSFIQMDGTRTSLIPNAIGTGATSSSDLNGGAVREACLLQKAKLEQLCMQLLQKNGSEWCISNGLNYWDYPNGWQATVTTTSGGKTSSSMIWNNIVNQAFQNRVDLSSQALYRTPGLDNSKDQQFYAFTYSACCSEVEIDVLTGETTIIRSDVLYDIGESLNPAIDIGQIEGAFVMGTGNMLSEKIVWEPKGTANPAGMLNTPNTWTYKPPCAASIPLDFRVDLFPREDAPEVPSDPHLVMSSKGIGEPPLVLSNTVFFAVKHAVLAARKDRGITDWFEMDAPATVSDIKNHCRVDLASLQL